MTPSSSVAPELGQEPVVDPVLACVAQLPLDVRIGQTMLVTTTDIGRVQQWLDDGLIAGILSSGRLTPALAGALDEATTGGTYGALLAADEEGGQVQRYSDVIGAIPSARQQATSMTPDEVRAMYARHGSALADWGVDLVFAPVVDVGFGPGVGSRAYSDDPEVVTDFGTAAAQGYADAGLLPVLKHFPGHGNATGDSHDQRAAGPAIDDLRGRDLLPFRSIGRDVDAAVMVGHTTVPGYADEPSSQSRQVIEGLLVDEVGFEGLIISDALGMEASGVPTQGGALVGFIAAGGDLGIVGPGGSIEGRKALRGALEDGTVSDQRLNDAAAAVLAAKGIDPCAAVGGPAPQVQDSDVPDDPAVVNPTQEP
jgi:beta-N-acetylhexosaminidase